MSGKGSSFEREICKDLSRWIQGTEKPYIFWRGRGSGGMFTQSNLIGESFAGDIYLVREEGRFLTDRFSIECKTGYKEASLDKHLKYNKSDPIKSFWEQCTQDAKKTNKLPLLIYQKKGMQPKWVGINTITNNKFYNCFDGIRHIVLEWGKEDKLDTLWFYGYEDFWERITPEIIRESIYVSNTG
jgi:hypothetical protein